LYKKAALPDGHPDKIEFLTGVSDTYENPVNADLVIDTGKTSLEDSTILLLDFIDRNNKHLI
jgi:adenylylsulfate kinase